MRKIYRTEAFDEFFESLPDNVKEQVRYLLFMITEMKVVNTTVVTQLVDTDLYALRISVGNEYRAILFTIDHDNIVQAEQILLLNGFMKKSTNDYKKEILKAQHILDTYYEKED